MTQISHMQGIFGLLPTPYRENLEIHTKDLSKVCSLSLEESEKIKNNLDIFSQENSKLFDKNQHLINTLFKLRDLGNTVIVVEHDEEAIKQADHIIDIGVKAGIHGGKIIFQGPLKDIYKEEKSLKDILDRIPLTFQKMLDFINTQLDYAVPCETSHISS